MRLLICAAAAAGVLLSAQAPASADTIRLRIGAGHPAGATWTSAMREFFQPEVAKRVAAETGDTIEWVEAYGGSVCKLGECLEAVEAGLLDIADVESIFEPAKLQAHNFSLFVPFSTPDPEVNAKVIDAVYDEVPELKEILQKKYNQIFLGAGVIGNYGILTTFPWKDPSELKGRKLAAGGPNIPWITPVGAVPVQAVLPEVYTSLQTGVYDGVVMFPDAVVSFRLNEVANHFAEVDFGTVASALITINQQTWDGLSPKVQEILTEVGREWSQELGERTATLQDAAIEKMKQTGDVWALTPEQRQAWADSLDNLPKQRAEEINKAGDPGEAIYVYIDELKKAGHQFPRDWAAEK